MKNLFGFEQDFAEDLEFIPMTVRYRLDLCGIKLSLRQWRCFTIRERRDLLECECDAAEIAVYRARLVSLIAERAAEEAVSVPVVAPAWLRDPVPDQLTACMQALGIEPLSDSQWRSCSILQRFALLKLSRKGHANENLFRALREFGAMDQVHLSKN